MKHLAFILGLIVAPSPGLGQGFLVLQDFFYAGQPSDPYFENVGLKTNYIVYQDRLGSPSVESKVRYEARRSVGRSYTGIVQMDQEYWGSDVRRVGVDSVRSSVRKMCETLRWFKTEEPGLKVGFYGFVPVTNLYAYKKRADSLAWTANDDLLQPLADSLDYLCPSIYSYYADTAQYAGYAKAIIREARRLSRGKPVYPYISPQYHPAGDHDGEFLSYKYFGNVLKVMKDAGADGVVIWGGSRAMGYSTAAWDSTWGWWTATREFMAALQAESSTRPPAPLVLAPGKGSSDQPTSSVARWLHSPAARSYHLQLADNITFQNLILNDSTITDTLRSLGQLKPDSQYYLRVRAKGTTSWTGYCVAVDFLTAGDEASAPPDEITRESFLEQNFPNPFNPSTVIRFHLGKPSHASLTIYNLLGEVVRQLVDSYQSAGPHDVQFDASGLPSGVYFYRLRVSPLAPHSGAFMDTKRLVLLR